MDILKQFDEYSIKARLVPAFIVFVPVWVPLASYGLITPTALKLAGTAFVSLTAVLLGSAVVRGLGTQAQEQLYQKWGGKPSTAILRWRDQTHSQQFKQKLRTLIQERTSLVLLTSEEEAANPAEADRLINDAFTHLRKDFRGASNSMAHSDNIAYGFARNLFGSRWLWLFLAVVSFAFVASQQRLTSVTPEPWTFVVSVGFVAVALLVSIFVLPKLVHHAALTYATAVWNDLLR